MNQCFGARGTARHVHIDRDDGVDPLHYGVVVEHAASRGAGTHRNDPLGLRHLLINATDDRRELVRHSARADEHIGLPRRIAQSLHAKTREVEAARGRRHEFDGAAGRPEWHRPHRAGARPVHQEIETRRDPAVLRLRVDWHDATIECGCHSHVRAPFFQTYTKPTTRIRTKISISPRPKKDSCPVGQASATIGTMHDSCR